MKNTFKPSGSNNFLSFFFFAGLALSIGGCGFTLLYEYPAVVKKFDPQASLPALQPNEIYFFLSKDAFPPDLQSVAVGTLLTPPNSQWSYEKLIQGFQKKAAEIGANAVVFDKVERDKLEFGFYYYKALATAYRLYKQSPPEDVDLSATQYGTQNPDLQLVK